jgi:uncharacterized protein YuzE
MKKVNHDKEQDIVDISWWEKGEKPCGASEEITLLGVTIVIDRNRKGEVCSLEII